MADIISLPILKKVYPPLVANKIVSVQPLLGPTGLIYYLRHKYSQNKGNFPETEELPTKPRKYRSIDDPWEVGDDGTG